MPAGIDRNRVLDSIKKASEIQKTFCTKTKKLENYYYNIKKLKKKSTWFKATKKKWVGIKVWQ